MAILTEELQQVCLHCLTNETFLQRFKHSASNCRCEQVVIITNTRLQLHVLTWSLNSIAKLRSDYEQVSYKFIFNFRHVFFDLSNQSEIKKKVIVR